MPLTSQVHAGSQSRAGGTADPKDASSEDAEVLYCRLVDEAGTAHGTEAAGAGRASCVCRFRGDCDAGSTALRIKLEK